MMADEEVVVGEVRVEELVVEVSMLLRFGFGRPRFLVGRFGVEESEPEVGEEGDGDVRFSMCRERDGEIVWNRVSPEGDGARDVASVVGEKKSGSFGCVGIGLKG
jgi:hypothetical protein